MPAPEEQSNPHPESKVGLVDWICGLSARVQTQQAYGHRFFFVDDQVAVPFATITEADTEFDSLSNLSADQGYRVNVRAGREDFDRISSAAPAPLDHQLRNCFQPHPHYAAHRFVCIVNPAGASLSPLQGLIRNALRQALEKADRKQRDAAD